MSDLNYLTEEGRLNVRVGAVIQKAGKSLFVWANDGKHWYTLGGRVKFGESSYEAIKRELSEELGDVAALLSEGRLIAVNENFFQLGGKAVHELGYYYLFDGSALPDTLSFHDGDGFLQWLTPEQIKSELLYPLFLKEHMRFPEGSILHFIIGKTQN